MVCRIIWADRVAPRGAEAATGCEELAIVTTKKKQVKKIQIDNNLVKLSLLKGSYLIKSRIGEQWS